MRKYFYIALVLALFGCKVDGSLNPDLVGSWGATGIVYTFNSDFTYSIEYARTGDTLNPIIADSIWGSYSLDNKRSELTFLQEGYRLDSNQALIEEDLIFGTWEYEINGSVLKYSSNTISGDLERIE